MSLLLQKQKSIEEFEKVLLATVKDPYKNIVKYFISNIYIQIAEGEIERLEKIRGLYIGSKEWDKSIAIVTEIDYWQQQLNKIKQINI